MRMAKDGGGEQMPSNVYERAKEWARKAGLKPLVLYRTDLTGECEAGFEIAGSSVPDDCCDRIRRKALVIEDGYRARQLMLKLEEEHFDLSGQFKGFTHGTYRFVRLFLGELAEVRNYISEGIECGEPVGSRTHKRLDITTRHLGTLRELRTRQRKFDAEYRKQFGHD
jgi:hypothetical protein